MILIELVSVIICVWYVNVDVCMFSRCIFKMDYYCCIFVVSYFFLWDFVVMLYIKKVKEVL